MVYLGKGGDRPSTDDAAWAPGVVTSYDVDKLVGRCFIAKLIGDNEGDRGDGALRRHGNCTEVLES